MKIRNLREDPAFDHLELELQKQKIDEGPIIFSPGAGNWGDGLINVGSRQFMEDRGIQFEEIPKSRHNSALREGLYADRVVVLAGGGAWGKNWSRSRGIADEIAEQARWVVVFPSTYGIGKASRSNISYFARDKYASLENVPEAKFCHDLAFYTSLTVPDPEDQNYRLFAFREDREGHWHGKNFAVNLDISLFGSGDSRKVLPFFNLINQYRNVVTDRLHVAIAGAMVGVNVSLVAGNYGKNEDLFRSSMLRTFANVSLKDIEDVLEWYRY